MVEPLLAVDNVSCWFGGLKAVDGASLSAPPGRITALIGPNGAGKTTLFSIISGFVRAREGTIRYAGQEITGKPPHELARLGIARTFQIVQPFVGLSVRENILVGAHLHHRARDAALAVADRVGRDLGLTDMLDRPADTLRSPRRKRLELARALATEPKLLLLDEVLAGLNPTEIRDIVPVIRDLCRRGITILMIEHVMQAVMSLAEHVFVLAEGRVIAQGAPAQIAQDPAGGRSLSRPWRRAARNGGRSHGTVKPCSTCAISGRRLWRDRGAARHRIRRSRPARSSRCSARTASARSTLNRTLSGIVRARAGAIKFEGHDRGA